MKSKIALFCALLLVVCGVVVASFYGAYRGKVLPGVTLNNFSLANRSEAMTIPLLEKYFSAYQTNQLVLIVDGEKVFMTQDEFGFSYDAVATAHRAYEVGRRGLWTTRLQQALHAYRSGYEIAPVYVYDLAKLDSTIEDLASRHNVEPVEAGFRLEAGNVVVTPSVVGKKVDTDTLRVSILERLSSLAFQQPLIVPIDTEHPVLGHADAEAARILVEQQLKKVPSFVYENQQWQPEPGQYLTFLTVVDGSLFVDKEKVRQYVLGVAEQVNSPANEGSFVMVEGRVSDFSLPEDGVVVSVEDVVDSYASAVLSFGGVSQVPLTVTFEEATGTANQYGLTDVLGEGITYFQGSSSGRIHNIGLATSRVTGVLVPPGDVYSFNEQVGDISAETGYDQAYIISDRKTILGTGGGVCQVSTTAFRAALHAGLDIVERYPHSYRVHYYEPAGLDATVYAPYVDMKFKNNTSNHILVYADYNPESYELQFIIYGTDDGREVLVQGPAISPGAPAPEPIYQEDSSLAPGQVKQIDFAATGAHASVSRVVALGDETLINEQIRSSYSPWQAVYLVGPEE